MPIQSETIEVEFFPAGSGKLVTLVKAKIAAVEPHAIDSCYVVTGDGARYLIALDYADMSSIVIAYWDGRLNVDPEAVVQLIPHVPSADQLAERQVRDATFEERMTLLVDEIKTRAART